VRVVASLLWVYAVLVDMHLVSMVFFRGVGVLLLHCEGIGIDGCETCLMDEFGVSWCKSNPEMCLMDG
jgi:hypothetical protein